MATLSKDALNYFSEIGRAQKAWQKYSSAGRKDLADNAHKYANSIRDKLRTMGIDETLFKPGIDMTQYYKGGDGPAGNYSTEAKGLMTHGAYDAYQFASDPASYLAKQSLSPVTLGKSEEELLREQAQKEYGKLSGRFNSQISQLQNAMQGQIGGIDNSIQDAEQSLDNRYFQKYLGSRQQMANRGLSGSGLAQDQDTRLLLAKQGDLAGIYRDAATRKAELEGEFGSKISTLQNELSQYNEDDLFNQYKQARLDEKKKAKTEQMQAIEKLLPYLSMNKKDATELAFKYFEHGNLSASDRAQVEKALAVADIEGQYRLEGKRMEVEGAMQRAQLKASQGDGEGSMKELLGMLKFLPEELQREVLGEKLGVDLNAAKNEDIIAFRMGLDPTGDASWNKTGEPDTYESVMAELAQRRSAKEITASEFKTYSEEAKKYFTELEKQGAEASAKKRAYWSNVWSNFKSELSNELSGSGDKNYIEALKRIFSGDPK